MITKQAYLDGVAAALVDSGLYKEARNMSHPKGSQALASVLQEGGPVSDYELSAIRRARQVEANPLFNGLPETPAERLRLHKIHSARIQGYAPGTHLATPVSYKVPLGDAPMNKSLGEILNEGRVAAKPTLLKSLLSKLRL